MTNTRHSLDGGLVRQESSSTRKHSARVDELVDRLSNAQIDGNPSTRISSIAFDSRQVEPGSLFVALRGGYVDGHDFLRQARAAGATVAMVEPETPQERLNDFECVIRTNNTRGALAPLSAAFYGDPTHDLKVIGVTGTDGKTTTCWYLRQMLEILGDPTGLISTVSVHIPGSPARSSARQTTPESLDVQRTMHEMVEAGARFAVLETTSHALETHRVDHCRFDVGVVTNVTREHLDFHGSIENYRRAKGKLLQQVAQSAQIGGQGAVVLNADDEGTQAIAAQAGGCHIVWYSTRSAPTASIRANDIQYGPTSSRFTLQIDNTFLPVLFALPGSWNVSNCLAAAGTLHVLGYAPGDIAKAIEQLLPVPGRMASIEMGQPFSVLVDYAHTPESIRSVLVEARKLTRGKVLIAFGSAGERDVEKRFIQGAVAAELADYAIFTSEDPRFEDPERIIEAIAKGAEERGAVRGVDFDCIEDRASAVRTLISRAEPGDIVILAGKGHEQSMIYGAENRPWDEAGVARDMLRAAGYSSVENEGTTA